MFFIYIAIMCPFCFAQKDLFTPFWYLKPFRRCVHNINISWNISFATKQTLRFCAVDFTSPISQYLFKPQSNCLQSAHTWVWDSSSISDHGQGIVRYTPAYLGRFKPGSEKYKTVEPCPCLRKEFFRVQNTALEISFYQLGVILKAVIPNEGMVIHFSYIVCDYFT